MQARSEAISNEFERPALVASGPTGALALLEAMRPRQWLKNVFVFAGVVFAGRLFSPSAVLRSLAAFGLFCLAASSVYLVNDFADRHNDAHHPTKRARPIASGRLSPQAALVAAAALAAVALVGSLAVSRGLLISMLGYLAITGAYNFGLKRVFIVDAIVVAAGFVIRAAAGAAAIDALISPWLLSCTFQLALFLALGKRRHELTLLGETAGTHRKALSHYTVALLDSWLTALTGATIVAYALYTQAPRTVEHFHTTNLIYTVPFVVYALFRYQHRVVQDGKGGDPGAALVRDPGMILAIVGWALAAAVVIYVR